MDTSPTRHPNAMWYISAVSGMFSFSAGIILSLLILYLTARLHIDQKNAYTIFAAFMALMYTLPLLGGYVGGMVGHKKALVFSILLLLVALGFLQVISYSTVYIGLGLFALGHGFYLPNLLVLLGRQYAKESKKRDSGFTLYYALMNVGYLISFFIGGYIQSDFGFHISFMVAAVPLMVALMSFVFYLPKMQPHPTQHYNARTTWSNATGWLTMLGVAVVASPLCMLIMRHAGFSKYIIFAVTTCIVLGVLVLAFRQRLRMQTYKLIAFIMLALISIGFWALYMLEPSLFTLFINNSVSREVFGHVIPPSTFIALNPMFTILLGGVYGALWLYLARRGKDLSVPGKFALSLFAMFFAFVVLYMALGHAVGGQKISFWWMVPVYFFLSSGELFLSPIGQGAVGRLAPEKLEGLLMGAWQVFIGASASLSGVIASMAAIGRHTDLTQSNLIYRHTFYEVAGITLGVAIVTLLLVPFLKKAMYHHHDNPPQTLQMNLNKG